VKVLVTGAAGFLADTLVPLLCERHDVVGLVRAGDDSPLDPRAARLPVDLAAGIDAAALPSTVDVVVHLAQSEHFRQFPERAGDIFAVNVAATAALLDYARSAGAQQFVLASTGGVCTPGTDPLPDDAPAGPSDFYQRSKYAAEVLTAGYEACFSTAILRPFFIYGPGQSGMLVPNLATRVRRGDEIVVGGDPGMTINPIHVSDAAAAFAAAVTCGESGCWNVAGAERVTISGLVRVLAEFDGTDAVIRNDAGAAPSGDLIADTAGMRGLLGVTPSVPLRDGLREVLDALPEPRRQ
jgi:nucleoside-diphosphate-sugar epimerase